MDLWGKVKGAAERTANFVTGGMNDRKKSERIERWAKEQEEEARQRLAAAQQATSDALARLGQRRVQIYETTVKDFVNLYEMMGAINLSDLADVNRNLDLEPALSDVSQLKVASDHVEQMLIGGGAGAIGGASLALGAWGLAGMVGTASTGTAIGTLSGAAATNATLAWLGGGAASAGGMGVTGGMAVLGGVVVIPVAMAAMYFGQNSAKQKLNEARNYQDEVDTQEEQINTYVAQLEQVKTAAELMLNVIDSLDSVVQVQNQHMRARLLEVGLATRLLHAHLATPFLDDKGQVTDETLAQLEHQHQELGLAVA